MKLKKVFKKITFSFSKVNFSLWKKNLSKKSSFFFYFRSHERSELPAHYTVSIWAVHLIRWSKWSRILHVKDTLPIESSLARNSSSVLHLVLNLGTYHGPELIKKKLGHSLFQPGAHENKWHPFSQGHSS